MTVDGTEKVTGWKDAGGGLVAADTDLPPDPDFNAVFLDNARAAEGRWPNSGADPLNATWAEADTTSTDQHIDDTDLPDANWTGATVHLWAGSNPWAQQTGTATANSPGKLDFKGGNYRCPPLCMGNQTYRNYYLVGTKAALDEPGEWFYDKAAHRLYLVPPKGGIAGHTVTAKHRLWGVELSDSSYVTVRGLNLWGTSANRTIQQGCCGRPTECHLHLRVLHPAHAAGQRSRDRTVRGPHRRLPNPRLRRADPRHRQHPEEQRDLPVGR